MKSDNLERKLNIIIGKEFSRCDGMLYLFQQYPLFHYKNNQLLLYKINWLKEMIDIYSLFDDVNGEKYRQRFEKQYGELSKKGLDEVCYG